MMPRYRDRSLPIIRPYLRRNIVEGIYANQEHYLDVQFRLLREDFISPMRDGIVLWKQRKGQEVLISHAVDAREQLDLLVVNGVTVEGSQLKRSTGEIIRYASFRVHLLLFNLNFKIKNNFKIKINQIKNNFPGNAIIFANCFCCMWFLDVGYLAAKSLFPIISTVTLISQL
ncbi:unnamed protein product [Gongylonema pulchrum]|uniref:Uncharacterized protein n=1 Tax=Gongylonema pulchrum TaxID=637853 RepID=A0A183EYY9_9BILA|nr:unnamed protein product [Gongylonema pulchrum]